MARYSFEYTLTEPCEETEDMYFADLPVGISTLLMAQVFATLCKRRAPTVYGIGLAAGFLMYILL